MVTMSIVVGLSLMKINSEGTVCAEHADNTTWSCSIDWYHITSVSNRDLDDPVLDEKGGYVLLAYLLFFILFKIFMYYFKK